MIWWSYETLRDLDIIVLSDIETRPRHPWEPAMQICLRGKKQAILKRLQSNPLSIETLNIRETSIKIQCILIYRCKWINLKGIIVPTTISIQWDLNCDQANWWSGSRRNEIHESVWKWGQNGQRLPNGALRCLFCREKICFKYRRPGWIHDSRATDHYVDWWPSSQTHMINLFEFCMMFTCFWYLAWIVFGKKNERHEWVFWH